ncbi:MAG: PadR family transcriptional regulator [Defluviitaleaceae bacterium]|nr:PadR family transcriptional regulator [Defluviitaleaceae bacterium]
MDKLILGLLMMKKLTVYEMKAVIKANYRNIYSDSMGAIQFAIKKLLKGEMITVTEYVERSVNKKQYAITEKGKAEFTKWLHVPANFSGATNTELGKLLFMGMLPSAQFEPMIDEMIKGLEKTLVSLMDVHTQAHSQEAEAASTQVFESWKSEPEYFSDVSEKADNILFFQRKTLQYGIDSIKFDIEWFKKLKEEIK